MTPEQEPITAHRWIVAGTVLTGTIMAVLDSSIVNVALPDMSGTLGVTIEEITWVVTAYILAQVIVMPITVTTFSRSCRRSFSSAFHSSSFFDGAPSRAKSSCRWIRRTPAACDAAFVASSPSGDGGAGDG